MLATVLPVAVFMLILYRLWSVYAEALDRMRCTKIVIAHRLSTIRHCDRILVLDGGRIIEDGTYEALIAKKGFFAELVARQQ